MSYVRYCNPSPIGFQTWRGNVWRCLEHTQKKNNLNNLSSLSTLEIITLFVDLWKFSKTLVFSKNIILLRKFWHVIYFSTKISNLINYLTYICWSCPCTRWWQIWKWVEYEPMLCWYIVFDIYLGKGIILFSSSLPKYITIKTFHQEGLWAW
jgi:hypothetical protein